MSRYYHVDRSGKLLAGATMELKRWEDIKPAVMQEHADALFPKGFSLHGNQYFLYNKGSPQLPSPRMELLWEYVRRACFPEKLSRFQSVFAWADKEEAVWFRREYCSGEGSLVELEGEVALRADMSLLRDQNSILSMSYCAHCYWKGMPYPIAEAEPRWEVLLRPPVQVLRVG